MTEALALRAAPDCWRDRHQHHQLADLLNAIEVLGAALCTALTMLSK
jgi:hypothetical protein